MTITYKGLQSIEGKVDGKDSSTSSSLVFLSECDEPPLTVGDLAITEAVSTASGFRIGTRYPFDRYSWCRSISSRCNGRRQKVDNEGDVAPKWQWLTTVDFSSANDGAQQGPTGNDDNDKPALVPAGAQQQDPALRPPKVSISLRHSDVPVDIGLEEEVAFARHRGLVCNSVGDPIVRTKKHAQVIVRWEKYMRRWNWEWNQPALTAHGVATSGFLYSRNAAAWNPGGVYRTLLGGRAVGRGKARFESITSEISFEAGGCVFVTAEIAIDDQGFVDAFLDQGFFCWRDIADAGANPHGSGSMATGDYVAPEAMPAAVVRRRRRFVDANGGFANVPQLLDGGGLPLPDGQAPRRREYQYYPYKNWNAAPWGPVGTTGRFFAYPIGT